MVGRMILLTAESVSARDARSMIACRTVVDLGGAERSET